MVVTEFDEVETCQFQVTMLSYANMLLKIQQGPECGCFIDTALGFLLRGLLANGADQVLWNIAAIEAVFGEKVEGLVRLLKSRVSRVLGHNERERKEISKRFDALYAFRSDLVHGNAKLSKTTLH